MRPVFKRGTHVRNSNYSIMSIRKISHFKSSTSKVIHLLEKSKLSFREIAWNLRLDDDALSRDIKQLVADGVIERKFHHNTVLYSRIHRLPLTRALDRLEALVNKL